MNRVIPILIALMFISCSEFSTQNNLKDRFSDENYVIKKLENDENNEPWNSGNYATMYNSEKVPGSLEEVKHTLSYFESGGISLKRAWFSKGESSCGMLQAVVPDEIVLEIDSESLEMLNPLQRKEFSDMFKPVNGNDVIWCPLTVYEITPK